MKNKIPLKKVVKTIQIFIKEEVENSCLFHMKGNYLIQIGNIHLTPSKTKEVDLVHIRTGRGDSLEGRDFPIRKLEKTIQDFFDKEF